MSGVSQPKSSVVVRFPISRPRDVTPRERVTALDGDAMTSPDYMPVACNDAAAMWILDQVRLYGSLDIGVAIEKIGRLFGKRFTVETEQGTQAIRKGVNLAVRDLSNGAVIFSRREGKFRRKQ